MLQIQVGSSASTAAGEHMQTWRRRSIAKAVRQVSISQRRAVLHVLLVWEVNTVHWELLNAPNAIWESTVEILPV